MRYTYTQMPSGTARMLHNPVNRAVVAYIKQRGAASASDIARHMCTQGVEPFHVSRLAKLLGRGILVNTTPAGQYARYVLGARAALFDQPLPNLPLRKAQAAADTDTYADACTTADAEPEADAHLPAWVGQKTPPCAYDVMHAPVYMPGPGPAMRLGAQDFLDCQSRGHLC